MEWHDTVYARDAPPATCAWRWVRGCRATTAAVTRHTVLDLLIPEPGACSGRGRSSLDVERRSRRHQAGSVFVTRATSTFTCTRRYFRPVDRRTGVRCDQYVELTVCASQPRDPAR